MVDLLLFLFATYGLTAILIVGQPMARIRRFLARWLGDHFVKCWLCMGFWSAIVCWLILRFISDVPLWLFAGAGVAYFINNLASEANND